MTASMLYYPVQSQYGIYAVAREIAVLLEPDDTLRDGAYARPVTFVPGRSYVWPRRDTFVVDDMNPTWRETFELRCAYAVAAPHEIDVRDPLVTSALEAHAEAYISVIRHTLSGQTFDSVWITAVDYEMLVTLEARGFYMDLAGYRRRTD